MGTEPSRSLPAFTPEIAERARQDINILSVSAYADAAVHSADKIYEMQQGHPRNLRTLPTHFQSVGGAMDAFRENFDETEEYQLIERAFSELAQLIQMRTISYPTSAERDFRIGDQISKLEDLGRDIERAVEEERLPESCKTMFAEGMELATTEKPREKWVAAAKARSESGWPGQEGGGSGRGRRK